LKTTLLKLRILYQITIEILERS